MSHEPYRNRLPGYHPLRKIRTAIAGLSFAVFSDFTVRYKFFVSLAFLIVAGVFETLFHFVFVLLVTGLMMVAEILNTAIESICDFMQPNEDERIKNIKDAAAAATFIAILIWYAVLAIVLYELLSGIELFA